ncbi:MAG: amino acid--[acyl-carrier-protein] ligase [Actinobacteria bacterium]|nr:amino acid--[acyl-carrier-protein] ligase [Actinomycetota bacterium]
MAEYRPGDAEQTAFLQELVGAGLLIESGIPGVYGRGEQFERVRWAFDRLVTRAGDGDAPERMAFPPVLPRRQLERIGYLNSFPHLAGSLFSFDGDEDQAAEQAARASRHEDWSGFQSQTDLVLTPAACYPVYPAVAARGPLPPGGVTVDAGGSYVFRNEPSGDPARLQMFHQREIVRIGEPDAVAAWRDTWRDRAVALLRSVGLDAGFDVANDPFFGRSGRLLARSQRSQELKFEVLVQIAGPEPTAVASFNYHQDHFSGTYGITVRNGGGEPQPAHTACLGFGLERITLALLRTHGLDVDAWPATVREELALA